MIGKTQKALPPTLYPPRLGVEADQRARVFDGLRADPLGGFDLKRGVDTGRRLFDALKPFYQAANIGDARSLAIHPASRTYQQLNAEDQLAVGVTPDDVRLSIGFEHPEEIIGDLALALYAAGAATDVAPARRAAS